MGEALVAQAHDYLDWVREGGVELDVDDPEDHGIWFIRGALGSVARGGNVEPAERSVMAFSFAVHIAETLAATCPGVQVVVEHRDGAVQEVMAVGAAVQNVLSWVLQCLDDPVADDVVFKYAGALRDFGQAERSRVVLGYLAALDGDG